MPLRNIKKNNLVANLSLSLITLLLFLLILEGVVRTFFEIKNSMTVPHNRYSDDLGWAVIPELRSTHTYTGNLEAFGTVEYSSSKYGFRIFGNVDTKKTKIFVIGDSYTEAQMVTDGATYFDYLQDTLDDIEVFAYGSGGYASLQEYMILDKYYDLIKPDIILWQFTYNDIISNDYDFESSSIQNNRMRRPYYQNGNIEYLTPRESYGPLYDLINASYLFKLIDIKLDLLKGKKRILSDDIAEHTPLIRRAVNTTTKIMALVKKRAGDTPIIVFSASDLSWLDVIDKHLISKLFLDNGMHFIPGIHAAVDDAKKSGMIVDASPYDVHWNHNGHQIAGKRILDYLLEKRFVNDTLSK